MFSFLGYFLTFLILGVPISLALGVGGLLFLYFTDNWMLVGALPGKMLQGVDQFILLTIPLFLLAGNLMMASGLSRIGEVFNRIVSGAAQLGIAHATSGPCLQHNLVTVLEKA